MTADATERRPPKNGTGMPAAIRLDAFGQRVFHAFGNVPYLVGTAAVGKQWRDVDVRLILDDGHFDSLFPGYARHKEIDACWSLICDALAELAKQMTGLPVDFQIQRQTQANKRYGGQVRIPLMYLVSPEWSPPETPNDPGQPPSPEGPEG